jgi:hypothetical protein
MKLGHKPASQAMRVYGVDLVIAQNDIFSIYMGDETGTNLNTDTEVFVQRTGIDGSLIWLKHYQLPGNNNWVDEIIESQGGLVILARNRVSPSDLFLFKIDYDGNVQWAKQFDYAVNDNAAFLGSIQSQLIEADNHLYFTAFAEGSSNNDLILAKTDLDGEIGGECMESTDISIPVLDVNNPVFYNQTPMVTDYEP